MSTNTVPKNILMRNSRRQNNVKEQSDADIKARTFFIHAIFLQMQKCFARKKFSMIWHEAKSDFSNS